LAEALALVIRDAERRRRLAAGARAIAPRFDIARATEVVTARYEKLAAARANESAEVEPSADTIPTVSKKARRQLDMRPAEPGDRSAILALLGASLGWDDDERFRSLYSWKHETNPFGRSLGWVVEDAGEVVALRLFMRWEFIRGDRRVRAVRAVDTATHPSQQGKGLFTALTLHALDACRTDGVDFVFNTPNEQSRPGYLKMGWRQVGRLPAAVRPRSAAELATIVRSRTPADFWSLPLEIGAPIDGWLGTGRWEELQERRSVSSTDRTLRTATSLEFARWRYGLPALHYRVVDDGAAAVIVRLRARGPSRELVVAERLGDARTADRLAIRALLESDASHALRLGGPNLRAGYLSLPGGGPILTWRAVTDFGEPPLPNWDLQMRDIELF
jgi:GNAT superfamily N-acetyltransferase